MQTKTIDKLEGLKGYEWEERGLKLKLDGFDIKNQTLQLHSENFLSEIGDYIGRFEFVVSKYNLEQLEFYGLKVILNEKPKLTREEKVFLELLEDNYVYIARSQDSSLSLFNDEPRQASEDWYISIDECEDDDYGILLLRQTFPFITWESGKAWSKAELMELKVID